MTGGITAAGVLAATAVAGVGMEAYSMSQQGGISSQARGQSGTVFGEQQYYAQQLQKLIADPSSVTKLPGYQFQLGQGEQAVHRQMASSGFAGSGNEATALTQYGQGFAQNAYQSQVAVLSSLAGLSSPVNPTQGLNMASNAAGRQNDSLQQLLGTMTFMSGQRGMYGGGGGGVPMNSADMGGSTSGWFTPGQMSSVSTGFASPSGPG